MFQTLAGILGETEPEPSFFQLVQDHLSLLLKELERYFPTTEDLRTGKKWIGDSFVNKPGESSMSVQEKDQLLEIANDGNLKTRDVEAVEAVLFLWKRKRTWKYENSTASTST